MCMHDYNCNEYNRVSGVDRKDCPFYDIFDSILGTRAATEPPLLLESSEPPVSTAIVECNEFEGGTFVCLFNAYNTIMAGMDDEVYSPDEPKDDAASQPEGATEEHVPSVQKKGINWTSSALLPCSRRVGVAMQDYT